MERAGANGAGPPGMEDGPGVSSRIVREACAREIALTLAATRASGWLGLVESRSEQEFGAWVDAVARIAEREDRPVRRTLPRSPSRWLECLDERAPLALTGLEALLETSAQAFLESSSAMKGVALAQALSEAPTARVLAFVPRGSARALRGVAEELFRLARAHFDADLTVPAPPGARLQPIPASSQPARDLVARLRVRVQAQRGLVDGDSRAHVAGHREYWPMVGDLARLEVLVGDTEAAARHFGTATQSAADPAVRSTAHEALGDLALGRGDAAGAASAYRRALHYAKKTADAQRVESCLLRLGETCTVLGNYEDALRYYELARVAPHGAPGAPQRLESAIRQERERLARAQDEGDRVSEAQALTSIGRAFTIAGRHDEAARHLEQGAELFAQIGDVEAHVQALQESGLAHARRGDLARAMEMHDQALAALSESVAELRSDLPSAGLALGGLAGLSESAPDDAPPLVRVLPRAALLQSLARLYEEQGDEERAARFREVADRLVRAPRLATGADEAG